MPIDPTRRISGPYAPKRDSADIEKASVSASHTTPRSKLLSNFNTVQNMTVGEFIKRPPAGFIIPSRRCPIWGDDLPEMKFILVHDDEDGFVYHVNINYSDMYRDTSGGNDYNTHYHLHYWRQYCNGSRHAAEHNDLPKRMVWTDTERRSRIANYTNPIRAALEELGFNTAEKLE